MESTSVLKNKINTIEEPTKEQGMWIFANTECQVDKKVSFTWNSLFQAFPRQGVPNIIEGWSENWTEQGSIQEYHQVCATPSSQDFGTPMSGCDRVDYIEDRSWE